MANQQNYFLGQVTAKIMDLFKKHGLTKDSDFGEFLDLTEEVEEIVVEVVKPLYPEIKIDLKGHFQYWDKEESIHGVKEKVDCPEMFEKRGMWGGILRQATSLLLSRTQSKFTKGKSEFPLTGFGTYVSCSDCGERFKVYLDLETLTLTLEVDEDFTECEIRKDYSFDLNFPSSKIAFCNYFRGILDDKKYEVGPEGQFLNINYFKDEKMHTLNYASDNIGYVFVGNTSPTIHSRDDALVAGMYEPEGYLEHGNVCTDLWAVNFMDYSQLQKILADKGIDEKEYFKEQDVFLVDSPAEKMTVTTMNVLHRDAGKGYFRIEPKS